MLLYPSGLAGLAGIGTQDEDVAGRQHQRNQAIGRVRQYRVSRKPDEQVRVAVGRPNEEAAHERRYKQQKMSDRDRRYFGPA